MSPAGGGVPGERAHARGDARVDAAVVELYGDLLACEARHHGAYVELARTIVDDRAAIDARLRELSEHELIAVLAANRELVRINERLAAAVERRSVDVLRARGQRMGLLVGEHLHAVFHASQEFVGRGQFRHHFGGQQPRAGQLQGLGLAACIQRQRHRLAIDRKNHIPFRKPDARQQASRRQRTHLEVSVAASTEPRTVTLRQRLPEVCRGQLDDPLSIRSLKRIAADNDTGLWREHGLTMDQLAHRLCRSTSWVSRRLGLLEVLVASAHDRVRAGTVPAHAAMKYLVPLARANKRQCAQMIAGLGDTQVSVREFDALYQAWKRADRAGKQRIVAEPLLVLRALAAMTEAPQDEAAALHKDLSRLAAVALRAGRRARDGGRFTAPVTKAWRTAREAFAALGATIEEMHAGPEDSTNHPEPA